LRYPKIAIPGETLTVHVEGASVREILDPQGVLDKAKVSANSLSGTVKGDVGWHTLFVLVGEAKNLRWEPLNLEIRPAFQIMDAAVDGTGRCHFVLRNNSKRELRMTVGVSWAGERTNHDVYLVPGSEQKFAAESRLDRLLLGGNRLEISDLGGTGPLSAEVPYWPEKSVSTSGAHWRKLSLDSLYKDAFATVLLHPFWSSEVRYAACLDYAIAHLNHFTIRNHIPDDSRLRAAVDKQGVFLTRYGIPFAQRKDGNNIVALSRWTDFPNHVEIPVDGAAKRIYVFLSALTFPMQSHIANARVTVRYADGGETKLDLVNPDNLDNGWGQYGGTYHYASVNGMELLSLTQGPQERARSMQFQSNIILDQHDIPGLDRNGEASWEERPHAEIIAVDCQHDRQIDSLRIEVLSNDVIIALLGVTVLE
jgi:hypothetical protein